ncbi:MAG: type III-A CRISPR-associated RAMP protein Csm3 [Candidatus Fervidibacterota bacterium]
MPQQKTAPKLLGKVVITAQIKVVTGLRVGAATSALDIGGIDQPVLRDPITDKPYIPGSSLKGKLRSLLTKAYGYPLQQLVRQPVEVWLHWCESDQEYRCCLVCPTFGQFPSGPGQTRFPFVTPTRLIVRDSWLRDELEVAGEDGTVRRLKWSEVDTDLPYTEVKAEVALDIITAASNPRQIERVPPGALFDAELLFSVFTKDDVLGIDPNRERERLRAVLLAMRLLEDDYLGASGTRGYGKIKFQNITVKWRPIDFYRNPKQHPEELLWQGDKLDDVLVAFDELVGDKVWGSKHPQASS